MSDREKQIAETLGKALEILPNEKKEFLIGYAEGVAAMASKQANASKNTEFEASEDAEQLPG